ncbi:hypothetical protein O0I10_006291 [Lichtheimia ornata]|uniref:Uncharacterized protein n=1 Tax=Lichtheimia ornata TaxID=688661 RepID=A0AAD7V4E2_9FUNG|nr:uncharacterized protein O0I10_006291 [Lichtheimia ornata]KAJ8658020.1 hypothetical protein O0I10_006291 [Lichtheimia ornata]
MKYKAFTIEQPNSNNPRIPPCQLGPNLAMGISKLANIDVAFHNVKLMAQQSPCTPLRPSCVVNAYNVQGNQGYVIHACNHRLTTLLTRGANKGKLQHAKVDAKEAWTTLIELCQPTPFRNGMGTLVVMFVNHHWLWFNYSISMHVCLLLLARSRRWFTFKDDLGQAPDTKGCGQALPDSTGYKGGDYWMTFARNMAEGCTT